MIPPYSVIVLALNGANARTGLDEKTRRLAVFPCGDLLDGYFVETSGEGIRHVFVKHPKSGQTGWIRISEKDGSNPLVSVHENTDPQNAIADAINRLAAAVEALKK